MRIKNIKLSGFDKIFEGYYYCLKDNRKGFGNNFFNYLNHAMISIDVDELSTIEIFYLKKFSSSIKIINKNIRNFVSKDDENTYKIIDNILTIHDEILNDNDINKNTSNINNILPIGCESYRAIILFKGPSIMSVTGSMIDKIFFENGKFPDIYPGNEYMETQIFKLFFTSFYKYMSENITDIDVVSEFITNKKYYQYSSNSCSLAHVNSPLGEITFFGNDNDKLQKQLKIINDGKVQMPCLIKENIYLTFVMNTTFNTFIKIFLNTNYVIDNENLKLIFLQKEIHLNNDIINKYDLRINQFMNPICKYKETLNNNSDINLNLFNFIFNGTPIKYSIQLSLADIEKFNNSLENSDEFIDIKKQINLSYSIIDKIFE